MAEYQTGQAGYDDLPDSIKQTMTLKEWMWLSDAEKAGLVANETRGPEWEE